jgi:2',3'-cyclic-nucleotide 2'-phosphodiesterase (5'-nucleotidase family)
MKGRKFFVIFMAVVVLVGLMAIPASAATYTVQSGDMLYRIAQMYGVTVQEIVALNGIKDPDLIFPGQVFVIPDGTEKEKSAEITIVHTNDIHSRVFEGSYDGMGYDKIATIVKAEMAKNPNTLVLDAGDAFHGQTISTLNEGESIVRIMNLIGYDVMTTGNHDFNYGQDRLLELAEMAQFDMVCANVYDKDYKTILPSYVIKEIDGVKIAIFGLATPETTYKTHPDNVKGLTFFDPVIIGKMMVAELKEKSDIIVCLSHLGLEGEDTSEKLAQYVDGIDVIVDGHSHTVLPQGMTVNNTLIVQAGEYSKNVGIVNLKLNNGVLTKSAGLITKEEGVVMAADPSVKALVDQVKAENDVITSELIGNTAIDLVGERGFVRTGETNLGNLITDAMLYETGADIAITNGGGIRSSIGAGPITVGDVITVLPFGNYVITKELTGAEIVSALEVGLDTYPAEKGAFPHIAGMKVTFDPSKPAGSRVVSVMVGAEAIKMDQKYNVATNDFLAAGGDGYVMFSDAPVTGNYPGLDEVLIKYIKLFGTEGSPVEGRILTTEDVSWSYIRIAA